MKNDSVRDLDLNFTQNPITGDLSVLTNKVAIKTALMNLIKYGQYEKPYQKDLYAGVYDILFEPNISDLTTLIENKIRYVVGVYEPRVKINAILISTTTGIGNISIQLNYSFLDIFTDNLLVKIGPNR
jgi:phage baseplate assembly protein W